MATYRPSFVDVSGLTAGISRGMEMAAQRKRQEDALAEQRVDDFLKTYRPDKLRDSDIPEFTNAYNNYKQAALQYSRMNRSGAKSEQLALANKAMNDALSGLNSVYGTSVKAANKMAEYAEAIKIGRAKGLSIPQEMLQASSVLSSAPISRFKVEEIPSAYSFKLLSEDYDLDKIFSTLDRLGAKSVKSSSVPTGRNIDYMGNKIPEMSKVVIEERTPDNIARTLPIVLSDPSNNGLKLRIDREFEAFKNSDSVTKQTILDELKKYFPKITEETITPREIGALTLYTSNVTKSDIDDNYLKTRMREIDRATDIGLKKQALSIQRQKAAGSKKSKSYILDPMNEFSPLFGELRKTGKVGEIPVTRVQAYDLKDEDGKRLDIKRVVYNPNNDTVTIEAQKVGSISGGLPISRTQTFSSKSFIQELSKTTGARKTYEDEDVDEEGDIFGGIF